MRREKQGAASPPEPPDGSSADLHLLKEGDEVLAYYTPESLWYPATLNGIFEMPGDNHSAYYSVIYTGYNEVETVYPESLRAQPKSLIAMPLSATPDSWSCQTTHYRSCVGDVFCYPPQL